MKKITKTVISLLLVVVVLCSFSIRSLAFDYDYRNNNYHNQDNQNLSSAYFVHLRDNFSLNEMGSCTFVSIQMLLSYYDSFWNDIFVPEQYDVTGNFYLNSDNVSFHTSSGVESEMMLINYSDCVDYEDFVEKYKDRYFQLKLIDLALEEGYIFGLDEEYLQEHPQEGECDFSLSDANMVHFLEYYLYDYLSIDEQYVTVRKMLYNEYSEADIREQLIENLENGVPTIFGGRKVDLLTTPSSLDDEQGGAHAMIAYDYDPDNDSIFYHMGWHQNDDKKYSGDDSNSYDYDSSIIWLEINEELFGHECTDNYTIHNTIDVMCLCKFDIHPAHSHTLSYTDYDLTTHTQQCYYCDEVLENAHKYTYTKYSETQHVSSCACGYSKREVHIVKGASSVCLLCRALVDNGYIHLGINGQVTITNNNTKDGVTYVREDGIIVLSEIDYYAFESGQLAVDEIYERLGVNND